MKRIACILSSLALLCQVSCTEKVIEVVDNTFVCEAWTDRPAYGVGETVRLTLFTNREQVEVADFTCADPDGDIYFSDIALRGYGHNPVSVSDGQVTFRSEPLDFGKTVEMVISFGVLDTAGSGDRIDIEIPVTLVSPGESVVKPTGLEIVSAGRVVSDPDGGPGAFKNVIDRRTVSYGSGSLSRVDGAQLRFTPVDAGDDFVVDCETFPTVFDETVRVCWLADSDAYSKMTTTAAELRENTLVLWLDYAGKTLSWIAGDRPGRVRLTFRSVYDPAVSATLDIFVRQDAVLVMDLPDVHTKAYGQGYSKRLYGYAGYLEKNPVYGLYTYDHDGEPFALASSSGAASDPKYIDYYATRWEELRLRAYRGCYSGPVSVKTVISATPDSFSDSNAGEARHLRGSVKDGGQVSQPYPNGTTRNADGNAKDDPRGSAGTGCRYDTGRVRHTVTGVNRASDGVTFASNGTGTGHQLFTDIVNNCNDYIFYDKNFTGSDNVHHSEWTGFSVYCSSLSYNTDYFNVRYILYSWKASSGGAARTSEADGQPWFCTTYRDQKVLDGRPFWQDDFETVHINR